MATTIGGQAFTLDSAEEPRFMEIVCRSSGVHAGKERIRGAEAWEKRGRPRGFRSQTYTFDSAEKVPF
jgi:hypothetical protein